MIRNELQRLWRQKELEAGHIITVQDVARSTGLHWETVSKLKSGQTSRYDDEVLAKMCQYFGVVEGQPIPFLVYAEAEVA